MTTAAALAERIAARATPGVPLVVGLTGSVASGKSTLAAAMVEALAPQLTVETVSTDGFLFPNAVLTERGILNRKGFPESYDAEAFNAAIASVRERPTVFPAHSHVIYDVDPALARTVSPPDVLLLEGLGFGGARGLDLLIYLDASEADLLVWFTDRFMVFWRAAEHDPASFYAQFRTMDEGQARAFAGQVWAGINLPNLREHIAPLRDRADWVVRKGLDHRLTLVRG